MNNLGNSLRTFLLLGVLTMIIILIGSVLGGKQGLYIAFVLALGMNFFSYWFSDRVVLSLYRAKEAHREEFPELFRIVEQLVRKAGMPMPRIYIIPQDSPNAFATGRNPSHAALGITRGTLRLLNTEELEGVLAHELGHVRNRDILVATIAATLAGVIMFLSRFIQFTAIFGQMGSSDDRRGGGLGLLLMAIIAPIAALIVQMGISRSREYMADSTGARLAGQPFGLARALEKIAGASKAVPMRATPATSHLFIVHPLRGTGLMRLFSTHPPIEERIRRLTSMNY